MAIPVFEGKIETAFTRKLDISGHALTDYLKSTLAKRGAINDLLYDYHWDTY
jgi:actin-related protein